MVKSKKYSNSTRISNEEISEIIPAAEILWTRSKEEIWSEISDKIKNRPVHKLKIRSFSPYRLAVAAVIIILIGISAFMGTYTKTIQSPAGEHSQIILPDNSKVLLNAQSEIAFKPFLWHFSRNLHLEGEAYFEVKPGKDFVVSSATGRTTVVGTSFNIYARNEIYQVTCVTGKVRVENKTGSKEVLLTPGQKAVVDSGGYVSIENNTEIENTLSWRNRRFNFTAVPLNEVFEEIGRQYNIRITLTEDINYIYSGAFNQSDSVEKILDLVCKPFGLDYSLQTENEYIISSGDH